MEWGEHMFKKVLWLGMLAVLCIGTCGCTQVIDLTDDETKLIAEYAADLLLSHDRGYDDRLQEGETELEESTDTEEQTTTEITSEASTETEQPADGTVDEPAVTEGSLDDIAQIAGIEGVSIRYQDYEIVKQYPTSEDGENAVQLDAPDGYELLVLRFDVAATQEPQASVSLMEQDINYELVCNGSLAAKPMLTILTNDLTTLETNVSPGQGTQAVLVFQIAESEAGQLDSMELRVTYNNVRNVITIL